MADNPRKSKLRGWIGLVLGLLMVVALPYVILPIGYNIPEFKKCADAIEEYNIEAAATYYSDVEACYLGEMNTWHAAYYPPKGPQKKGEGTPEP